MTIFRTVLLSCSAIAGLGTAFAAMAQQQSTGGLEEVVVTAQRRAEALEAVPASITVVTPESIERGGVEGLESIGRVAAGVQLNYAGAFIQPAIRGVSTLTNGNNIENNVAVYTDGFYNPSTITIASDMANIESVEVLKGPQGTLYGRNATGGAILIKTVGPSKTFTGNFDASYGRFDEKVFNGYVAGPITDTIRYSFAGHHRDTPGYFKLVSSTTVGAFQGNVGKIKEDGVTAKVEGDLTQDLTVQLAYKYAYNQDDRVNFYSAYGHINPTYAAANPPPRRATVYGTVAYNNNPDFQYAFRNEGNAIVTWKTGIGTLTSRTAYDVERQKSGFDFNATFNPADAYTAIKFRQNTFQESADYNIDVIKNLDLLVGGLYYHDHIGTAPPPAVAGAFVNGVLISSGRTDQKTTSWALYADGNYHLTDQLSVDIGGRFSHDYKNIQVVTVVGAGAPIPFTQKTWTKFTPRVSVRYELAERTDVYASWSRGYRMGNYSSTPVAGFPTTPTNPENVDAFEVGFKTAKSMFRFDSSAFYYNYRNINVNISVPAPSPPCPSPNACGNVSVFSNAPGANIYGLDAELTITPATNLNIHTGAEWLHARYKTFTNAVGTGVDATNTISISGQIQDWSNKQLARAPNFTANIGADYTVPTSFGAIRFATNLNYTTSFAVNNVSLYGPLAPVPLQGVQRFRQEAYALLSGNITWTAPSEKYYIQLWGRNLTNVTYRLNYNSNPGTGDYSPRGEPISYGGKFGVKF